MTEESPTYPHDWFRGRSSASIVYTYVDAMSDVVVVVVGR